MRFEDYWVGGLLHDIGKLVLGFFFWDHFEGIMAEMLSGRRSFRSVEVELGGPLSHQSIGRLLMLKSNAGSDLAVWVGSHGEVGESASPLEGLLHIANNLSKDIGLSYPYEEAGVYNDSVLTKLNLDAGRLDALRNQIGDVAIKEVKGLVEQYG